MSNNDVASVLQHYTAELRARKSVSRTETQLLALQFWLHKTEQTTSKGFIHMSQIHGRQMCSEQKHKIKTFTAKPNIKTCFLNEDSS